MFFVKTGQNGCPDQRCFAHSEVDAPAVLLPVPIACGLRARPAADLPRPLRLRFLTGLRIRLGSVLRGIGLLRVHGFVLHSTIVCQNPPLDALSPFMNESLAGLELTELLGWITLVAVALYPLLVVALGIRIVTSQRTSGGALAWLFLLLLLPVAGPVLYLWFGESRIGRRRKTQAERNLDAYHAWVRQIPADHKTVPEELGPTVAGFARLVENTISVPALTGNQLELIASTGAMFDAIVDAINGATRFCFLEYYIWFEGGRADDVAAALMAAARRGVDCRVLVDAVGSSKFLGGRKASEMQAAGVRIRACLAVGPVRMWFSRMDIRNHRKLVAVDSSLAITGSLNMADPAWFKQDAGVGEWVDAITCIRGPVAGLLAGVFAWDWSVETGQPLADLRISGDRPGSSPVQLIPSGPVPAGGTVRKPVLAGIYAAREELILTTPYFVPDESLILALTSAAQRGVRTHLVLPRHVDSTLVRLAARHYIDELLQAGVQVHLFGDGLLHTKSATVDGVSAFFGSLNLDMRSLWLNFELSMAVYDSQFTRALRELQMNYIERSDTVDVARFGNRSSVSRLAEAVARLFSPIL